ncbi:MAG: anaerobic sulfatase maturase [Deltaproteobacteria bacterium]|nr:anaerobic sulfatase maturase [Deltaproteobacteria bacterium]
MIKPQGPVCNLDCTYCYYTKKTKELPHEPGFRMSDATLEALVSQYIGGQPPEATEVQFAWQGGEPTLLGVAFFERAMTLQARYSRPGLRILNSLQTNGTLLDDSWGEFLARNDFLVGLSIDGPKELHDHFRKDHSGRGSFDEVMRGLAVLKRHRVEFNTLTTIHRANARHGRRVYEFLRSIGSDFMQFIPVVEREPSGAWSPRSVPSAQYGDFMLQVLERWKAQDVGRVYVSAFEMMIGILLGLPASLCVHAETCGRNIAVEHDGSVFRCDHFVFPTHRAGNLREASLSELVAAPEQIGFGDAKSKPLPAECRRCSFVEFCYGGCPARRPGADRPSYLCEGYKRFFSRSLPTFEAMAAAIRRGGTASDALRRSNSTSDV